MLSRSSFSSGQVGVPSPCVQIKLVDGPETGYYTADGIGEVCFKGYNVFRGYLNDAERTAEVLDADGWLHSGDIGRWTASETLKIVDRKKNIFKLSQVSRHSSSRSCSKFRFLLGRVRRAGEVGERIPAQRVRGASLRLRRELEVLLGRHCGSRSRNDAETCRDQAGTKRNDCAQSR